MTATLNDIYGYTIFANIDKRNGKIEGHRIIDLSKEQMEAIEIIITSEHIKVMEEPTYEVQKC